MNNYSALAEFRKRIETGGTAGRDEILSLVATIEQASAFLESIDTVRLAAVRLFDEATAIGHARLALDSPLKARRTHTNYCGLGDKHEGECAAVVTRTFT